jgi:hypothetical protein
VLYANFKCCIYFLSHRLEVVGNDNEDSDDDDSISPSSGSLGTIIESMWEKRRKKLDHPFAITGWALSVRPDVRADCLERMNGYHRSQIEIVVRKMHAVPGVNKDPWTIGKTEDEIVDEFWTEFKAFQKKQAPFDRAYIWNSKDIYEGKTWLWFEKYALPYTKVLGFVGCRVTSKTLGIGPCERSWGALKSIKTGQRLQINGESIEIEKRTILLTTGLLNNARIERQANEKIDAKGPNATLSMDDLK